MKILMLLVGLAGMALFAVGLVMENPWLFSPGIGLMIFAALMLLNPFEDLDELITRFRLDDRAKGLGKRMGKWLDRKFPADDNDSR